MDHFNTLSTRGHQEQQALVLVDPLLAQELESESGAHRPADNLKRPRSTAFTPGTIDHAAALRGAKKRPLTSHIYKYGKLVGKNGVDWPFSPPAAALSLNLPFSPPALCVTELLLLFSRPAACIFFLSASVCNQRRVLFFC
jgi:hypothetical protein